MNATLMVGPQRSPADALVDTRTKVASASANACWSALSLFAAATRSSMAVSATTEGHRVSATQVSMMRWRSSTTWSMSSFMMFSLLSRRRGQVAICQVGRDLCTWLRFVREATTWRSWRAPRG